MERAPIAFWHLPRVRARQEGHPADPRPTFGYHDRPRRSPIAGRDERYLEPPAALSLLQLTEGSQPFVARFEDRGSEIPPVWTLDPLCQPPVRQIGLPIH